jgi:hypothetical protein
MAPVSIERRVTKLETRFGRHGPAAHVAPGVVLFTVAWEPADAVDEAMTLQLRWEEEVNHPRRAHLPRVCSSGIADCPQMEGLTVFLPVKRPLSAPATPAPTEAPEDEDAEVGADALRQLAELRAQIARLEQNGHDQG